MNVILSTCSQINAFFCHIKNIYKIWHCVLAVTKIIKFIDCKHNQQSQFQKMWNKYLYISSVESNDQTEYFFIWSFFELLDFVWNSFSKNDAKLFIFNFNNYSKLHSIKNPVIYMQRNCIVKFLRLKEWKRYELKGVIRLQIILFVSKCLANLIRLQWIKCCLWYLEHEDNL